ncbi:MAG: ABC transporter permease [Ruminococcus sp.]
MSLNVIYGGLELGFIYGIMALGLYISFKIMNIPDLTTDGSFTLGLAVSAVTANHNHTWLGILFAFLAGGCAGLVTGFLQTKMRIHPVLAGIISMCGLYSINLMILGSPNLNVQRQNRLFTSVDNFLRSAGLDFFGRHSAKLIVSFIAVAVCVAIMVWFFRTHFGLCLRATGNNEDMVRASSINVDVSKMVALMLANGLIALSGGLIAQYQGYADISSGNGILVVGLASVIIGEAIFGKRSVTLGLISALAGSVLYRFIITWVINSGIFTAQVIRLITALIVAFALSIPAFKYYITRFKIKHGGDKNA